MAKSKPAVSPKKVTKQAPTQAKVPISLAGYITWANILILTVTFWLLYYNIFDHKPDMNGDNFAYMLLGKRLITGLGFTDATSLVLKPHVHFSPGYPAMIAVFIKIFGDDQDTISFMNGVMMYLSLILFYFITRRLTGSQVLAFAVSFLCAVNSILLRFSTITMSEVPYIFICALAIYTFILAVDDPKGLKSIWLYISIILMAYSYYIKSNSIAFAAGAGAYFLFTRDWKRAMVTLVTFGAIIFPWYLRTKKYGSSYMDQMKLVNPYKPELGKITTSSMLHRIHDNLVRYFTCDIPLNIFPSDAGFDKAPMSYWILGMVILALMIWGLYKLQDLRLVLLGYFGGSLAILMIWPTEYGFVRYITPFTPIILLLSLNGLKELIALAIGQKNITYVPYAFLLVGLVYVKPISAMEDQVNEPLPQNYVNYFALAKWAKVNTPKDAIFSARKPDMFIYYSDRLCVGDKPSLDDKEVMDFFREKKVDYVIIEQLGFASTGKFLVPAVQKNMDKFEIIYQLKDPDTYLLKFKR